MGREANKNFDCQQNNTHRCLVERLLHQFQCRLNFLHFRHTIRSLFVICFMRGKNIERTLALQTDSRAESRRRLAPPIVYIDVHYRALEKPIYIVVMKPTSNTTNKQTKSTTPTKPCARSSARQSRLLACTECRPTLRQRDTLQGAFSRPIRYRPA
jgi:hypothetical protein